MKKRPTVKSLKRKLDRAFSLMIRMRDADLPCISCGQYRELQAGHFIKREILATRWHPLNVHGECAGCNGFDKDHLIGYTLALAKGYGSAVITELVDLKRVHWRPLPDQLERLIMACDNPSDYESEWFAVQREFAPGLEAK